MFLPANFRHHEKAIFVYSEYVKKEADQEITDCPPDLFSVSNISPKVGRMGEKCSGTKRTDLKK
jgi:hypothetical protein